MTRLLALVACAAALCPSVSASSMDGRDGPSAVRPVATYSIVARDAATGEMGVAVQSHWFSVGPIVPWAEAGTGAVATQSLVKVSYGPEGLALMRGGVGASDAMRRLTAEDEGKDVRQVAMVDAHGGIAVHTGERCIQKASHVLKKLDDGTAYSCQANLMHRSGVPEAMAAAFEGSADRPLAERLVDALRAAERAGGDIRGRQSAAIIVVSGERAAEPWQGRLVDLRVEDNPDPVSELGRLLRLHRAYEHMNAGDLAVEHGDIEGAVREYGAARELNPGNAEMAFWAGVSMAGAGRMAEAEALLAEAYRDQDGDWRETLRRLPQSQLLDLPPEQVERLATLPAAN